MTPERRVIEARRLARGLLDPRDDDIDRAEKRRQREEVLAAAQQLAMLDDDDRQLLGAAMQLEIEANTASLP